MTEPTISDADLAALAQEAEAILGTGSRAGGRAAAASGFADRSNLDLLLDRSVHSNTAMSEIASRQFYKATDSTVEATIYALRKGTTALSQENVQWWLSCMNEKQLREVCTRVQRFRHAKPWTEEEVKHLRDVR